MAKVSRNLCACPPDTFASQNSFTSRFRKLLTTPSTFPVLAPEQLRRLHAQNRAKRPGNEIWKNSEDGDASFLRRAGQKATCDGFGPTMDKNPPSQLHAIADTTSRTASLSSRAKTGVCVAFVS